MNYGADLRVARSFEFDAVKTLGLWLGWLASRKLLRFLETPSFVGLVLGLGVLYAGLFVDVDLLTMRRGLLGLLEASLLVDVDFLTVLGRLLGLSVPRVLVDVDLFTLLRRTTEALFLVDADLLLDVGVVLRWGWGGRVNGGCEGFVRRFVTFPSVGSLLFLNLDFAFYLDTGRFLVCRVPIRRREDTEGDRNLLRSASPPGSAGRAPTRASKSSLPES